MNQQYVYRILVLTIFISACRSSSRFEYYATTSDSTAAANYENLSAGPSSARTWAELKGTDSDMEIKKQGENYYAIWHIPGKKEHWQGSVKMSPDSAELLYRFRGKLSFGTRTRVVSVSVFVKGCESMAGNSATMQFEGEKKIYKSCFSGGDY
ncbi:MAG: hypothetical protein JNL57_06635 [Bacteroidetes bacterium]|nr:hypothetical protein [Bacteroidota bacterium]